MKRYVIGEFEGLVEDENGCWIRHEDHLAALAAKDAEIERLRNALRVVNQILTVPAAEYVPAIPDAWAVIEKALAEVKQ